MSLQTSTDYNVDNRYRGTKGAKDNAAGKAFLNKFMQARRQQDEGTMTQDRREDSRFVISGPGDSTYGFKNAFRASLFNR